MCVCCLYENMLYCGDYDTSSLSTSSSISMLKNKDISLCNHDAIIAPKDQSQLLMPSPCVSDLATFLQDPSFPFLPQCSHLLAGSYFSPGPTSCHSELSKMGIWLRHFPMSDFPLGPHFHLLPLKKKHTSLGL